MINACGHKGIPVALAGLVAGAVVLVLWLMLPADLLADLQTPAWYDPNAVGSAPDWHYRVPLQIPAGSAVHATIRLDVNFNDLLGQLGCSGHFDANSPRVVRANGALAARQQFTDTVYAGSTDATGNGTGEIRFLLEDAGPLTYYLYFDVLENGAKPSWNVDNTINGNFEFLGGDRLNPPGWDGYVRGGGYQAQTIDNEGARTVSTNGGWPSQVTTSENANTGNRCYLMGARDTEESGSGSQPALSSYLRRTIDLPATNRGVLRIRFRVKGWDTSTNNQHGTDVYDFIRIQVRRSDNNHVIQELVGPDGADYAALPFSPNEGTGQGSAGHPGWGIYNGGSSGNPYSLPEHWYEATYDLSGTNRQSVDIYIETRNYYQYKSWFHIDDVEWSVIDAALGAPQTFGVNITTPDTATVYTSGDTLTIRARVDAGVTAAQADLYNPAGTLIASGIPLFNDGTHGDGTAGDALWTNDGSVLSDAPYIFLPTDMSGGGWQLVVTASDTQIGVTDAQVFTLVTPPSITLIKTVRTATDPVNGDVNPKAIPGAVMEYTITATNQGGTGTDADTVRVTDPIPAHTELYVGDLGQPGGPLAFIDGAVPSGLSFDPVADLRFSNDNGATFNVSINDLSADADGCDASITHLRVTPEGIFAAAQSGNVPRFTLRFRVRVR
jgi:uncharacterized repeat protein (TIGR01451 family)